MKQSAGSAVKVPNQFLWHIQKVIRYTPMHLANWMIDNRRTYPGFLFRAGYTAVGIVLATVAMHAVSTGFGIITEDVIMQAGTAILIIAFLCIVLFMLWGTHQAFVYRAETAPEEKQKKLPAKVDVWKPISIAPDHIICLMPGETLTAFSERANAAASETTHAIWAAIIPPFKNEVAILTAETKTDYLFTRGNEPFFDAPQEWAGTIDHTRETVETYRKYVDWFCYHFSRWASVAKLDADRARATKTLIETINAGAKAAVVTLYLLLFCLPVFGQSKTRQVDEALGTRIREIPAMNDKVTFIFREGSKEKYYERIGDGKSEYTALLQASKGIVKFDDEGGELIAVLKNGESVAKSPHVERVNEQPKSPMGPNGKPYLEQSTTGDPIRPRGVLDGPDVANTPVTDKPLNIHIPTPDEVQTTLDNASREIDFRKTEAWEAIKPVWKWIMGMFFSIVPLFICFGGLFRYYAGTAANEAFYGLSWIGVFIRRVHETASGITLLICWCVATVLLIDEFMLFVYFGIPLWAMLITWFPSLWIAKLLTNWVVPNPPGFRAAQIETPVNPYQKRIV